MAAVTICSDFGAPKNKVFHCFNCFPIYLPWSDGTRRHDLSFLNVQKTFRRRQLEYINFLLNICVVHLLYTKQWEYTDERQSSNSDKYLSCYGSTSVEWLNKKCECVHVCAAAKSLQSCPTLCNPIDSLPPGSPIPGILQARTLEWVAISFSNVGKWKVKMKSLSRVRLFATAWTAAHQAPLAMGSSRQEYWSGVSLPSPVHVCKC